MFFYGADVTYRFWQNLWYNNWNLHSYFTIVYFYGIKMSHGFQMKDFEISIYKSQLSELWFLISPHFAAELSVVWKNVTLWENWSWTKKKKCQSSYKHDFTSNSRLVSNSHLYNRKQNRIGSKFSAYNWQFLYLFPRIFLSVICWRRKQTSYLSITVFFFSWPVEKKS